MTIDLTSGLDESREFLLSDKPADPQLRESVSMWISDDEGVLDLHDVEHIALLGTAVLSYRR